MSQTKAISPFKMFYGVRALKLERLYQVEYRRRR
jgi:hypothetical protein